VITRILSKIKNESLKENIAVGLVVGLASGLVVGLAVGLASGLASGLAIGLVNGLASGLASGLVIELVYGLASGLVIGLVYGLASGLVIGLIYGLASGLANLNLLIPLDVFGITAFIISIIILSEFLFDSRKYHKVKSKFWFTAWRKAQSLFESLLIIVNLLNFRWLIIEYDLFNKIPYNEVLKWIGYIGAGLLGIALICLIFYLWIKLNEARVK
jgi:MFS family permease